MKRFARPLAALIALAPLTACMARVGTSGLVSVPSDAPATCAEHCSEIGMAMSAVVIMANNVGCVCTPQSHGPAASAASKAAPAAAGMAAILVQEEEQRRQAAH